MLRKSPLLAAAATLSFPAASMSDASARSTPAVRADIPLVPPVLPQSEPLAFPAVTSEGITPLRVPAMSREEAAMLAAELEAKSAAFPSSTELRVRVVNLPVPEADRVQAGLRATMIVAIVAMVGMLLGGLLMIGRGLGASRTESVQVDAKS